MLCYEMEIYSLQLIVATSVFRCLLVFFKTLFIVLSSPDTVFDLLPGEV